MTARAAALCLAELLSLMDGDIVTTAPVRYTILLTFRIIVSDSALPA